MTHTPLILLPGHMCDRQMWQGPLAALRDFVPTEVIELRGLASVEELAQEVLSQAPSVFALAGFSLGGYTALEIMRRAPERVARLALLDSSARPDAPENKSQRLQNIELARSGRLNEVVEAFALGAQGPVMGRDPELAQVLRNMMNRPSAEHYIAQQTALMNRPDARAVLATIECPTLIACGAEDLITTPDMHEEMADMIKNAAYVPIPDSGHMSPMEQPAAVSALLRYWLQAAR